MAYGGEYRRMVAKLIARGGDREQALFQAIGGASDTIAPRQRGVILEHGLPEDGFLVDVGCGAGRLGKAFSDCARLRYLGVDVVPDLVEYARANVPRPDWTFAVIDRARLPLDDGVADMSVYFSVFTHLSEADILDHLREAHRFLRPNGKALFSFLDPAVPSHRRIVRNPNRVVARLLGWARNVGATPQQVREWAKLTGFTVTHLESPSVVGQSLAVFQKSA